MKSTPCRKKQSPGKPLQASCMRKKNSRQTWGKSALDDHATITTTKKEKKKNQNCIQ